MTRVDPLAELVGRGEVLRVLVGQRDPGEGELREAQRILRGSELGVARLEPALQAEQLLDADVVPVAGDLGLAHRVPSGARG